MDFSKTLIHWYLKNNRTLPWRETKNPYFIWLSEIILQQTRVAQGMPYYLKFVTTFPTVSSLACAPEEEVLKLWQGLGYYSRARNLHSAARQVMDNFDGKFPVTYKELISLRGVGDYTASAISSICNREANAVVDGNVYRVLARFFGMKTPINSTKGIKEFKALAQELIDKKQPGVYNQAIMEFGALHCKPQNPLCDTCPLVTACLAYSSKSISELPVKDKKTAIKKKYFNYLVLVTDKKETLLYKRTGNGIWKGLYEFPLIETEKQVDKEFIINSKKYTSLFSKKASLTLLNQKEIVHKLSHQHLYTRFWIVETPRVKASTISWDTVKLFPVPVLLSNFIEAFSPKTR